MFNNLCVIMKTIQIVFKTSDTNLLIGTICTGKFNANFKFYWRKLGFKSFAMVVST